MIVKSIKLQFHSDNFAIYYRFSGVLRSFLFFFCWAVHYDPTGCLFEATVTNFRFRLKVKWTHLN